MAKIKIGVMCGGKSAEHEVSLKSAENVIAALDQDKYEVTKIMIGRDNALPDINLVKGQDIIFPVLHGPYGEDGTIQGFLKLAGIPFVGPGVLGSAAGMDKDVMKRLWRDAGLPIGKFAVFKASDPIDFEELKEELGLPLFIKPANLGSSVGISKAASKQEFERAVKLAYEFDTKIIVEEFIEGREIECAILGNEDPKASVLGEIIPSHEFYSYDAKYVDQNGAALRIPAEVPKDVSDKIRDLAVYAFKVLECEGLSRVDFFLRTDGTPILNEINTIPGFTNISMYPKLWEVTGIGYSELIDKLVELAITRYKKEAKLKVSP